MKVDLIDHPSGNITFVTMTKQEALRTIESLSHQLSTGSPNGGRYETFDTNGRSFTIAVVGE